MTVSDVPEAAGGATSTRWSAPAAAFVAWRDGDEQALEELVRGISPVLWQVARAAGLDRTSAEDVVQSTWLALVRGADTIDSPAAVVGWLCTTARREAWRVAKKTRRETATDDETLAPALPPADGPEADVVLADDRALLLRCLQRLDDRCRALLRIVAAGPRPDYADVSRTLGMPVGSIGPTRGRCLDKLRRELALEGGAS